MAGPKRTYPRILIAFLAGFAALVDAGCWHSNLRRAATAPEGDAAERAVSFVTPDGVRLRGHLYGRGSVGVILAHMYPADQQDWADFARILAANGYQALTFDFRGFIESEGSVAVPEAPSDLETAVAFMRSRVARIFLAGASLGDDASLLVAEHEPVAGVICISTPIHFMGLDVSKSVRRVKAPLLLITSVGDPLVAGESETLYRWATAPKSLKIFPGSAHGTALLHGPYGPEADALMLKFIRDREPAGS
jgi:pimeloyl-ACP methyl ester carboxylesterase